MIIPYKVKNPPKHFPVATVAIIALNVLIYAATTDSLLVIRRSVVDSYALKWGVSPLYTMVTSMFLHAGLRHLLGNMLFLWIFGPAVEDRLRIPGYLGVYFLTGLAGDIAHASLSIAGGASAPVLGASACIMGIAGAYWYLFPWSKVCVAYFFWFGFRVWYGVVDIAAVWVVGAYFLLDVGSGFLARAAQVTGGVANFAHVGGAITGAVLTWGLGMKRDTSEVSQIKATQAEIKDADHLTLEELRPLVSFNPEDEDLFVRYTQRARDDLNPDDIKFALDTNLKTVVTRCPEAAVYYLTMAGGSPEVFAPGDLIVLGRWCEANSRPDQAIVIYELVEKNHPEAPELEMALFRTACVLWHTRHDGSAALSTIEKLLSAFPAGCLMFEAEDLRDEIRGDAEGLSRPAA